MFNWLKKKPEKLKLCLTCSRWQHSNNGHAIGECRSRAPLCNRFDDPSAKWPLVDPVNWCGEWSIASDDIIGQRKDHLLKLKKAV